MVQLLLLTGSLGSDHGPGPWGGVKFVRVEEVVDDGSSPFLLELPWVVQQWKEGRQGAIGEGGAVPRDIGEVAAVRLGEDWKSTMPQTLEPGCWGGGGGGGERRDGLAVG